MAQYHELSPTEGLYPAEDVMVRWIAVEGSGSDACAYAACDGRCAGSVCHPCQSLNIFVGVGCVRVGRLCMLFVASNAFRSGTSLRERSVLTWCAVVERGGPDWLQWYWASIAPF